jgi:hypothetical protein
MVVEVSAETLAAEKIVLRVLDENAGRKDVYSMYHNNRHIYTD